MIPVQDVLAVLNRAGVLFVLAGAHALGGYTKKPRATVDVDVVICPKGHRKAIRAIAAAFPHLKVRDLPVVTRFVDPVSKESLIELMKPKDDLLKTIFENSVAVKIAGEPARIPDLEMAAATKFAAVVGVSRLHPDKLQDAADFARIIDANRKLDMDRLTRLAELVYAGGGEDVRGLVEAVRKRKPLVF